MTDGIYVWAAYAVGAALVIAEIWLLRLRERSIREYLGLTQARVG